MAVAAPALAIAGIALAALMASSCSAAAQEQMPCRPRLPELRSADGRTFSASAYGYARWMQRVATGKRLPYAMHVWKGKVSGRDAYLTFDEIPSTSGPNYHMDYRLKSVPVKIDWNAREPRFAFDARFAVYDGALRGEWTVTNCAAP
jgi:hypothetical protein